MKCKLTINPAHSVIVRFLNGCKIIALFKLNKNNLIAESEFNFYPVSILLSPLWKLPEVFYATPTPPNEGVPLRLELPHLESIEELLCKVWKGD